jgi:hypothetical protein
MAKIKKVWFDANRVYLLTDEGEQLSRPLEAFPVLKDASEQERLDFKIGRFGDDIRWEKLDEDVHISSFYETVEPNSDNEVARIFKQFPQLNVSEMAKYMGINKVTQGQARCEVFPLSISTSLGLFLARFFIFPLQNLEGEEKKVNFAA